MNNVNKALSDQSVSGLRERVHIIPLGHEIDRAIKPFQEHRADRAYVLTVSPTAELDKSMLEKQQHFTQRVCEGLKDVGIESETVYCNLFDILESLMVISSLIVLEKDQQHNEVFVNMSACGRKTSIAATLAAMVHRVQVYYVRADRYTTGGGADLEWEHGLSIVEKGEIEPLYNFQIMMPDRQSQKLLVELFKRPDGMYSDDIFRYFQNEGIYGYEELPKKKKKGNDFAPGPLNRALLNRTNRNFLMPLEKAGYVTRDWEGRKFLIQLTESGKYIACVSGLLQV